MNYGHHGHRRHGRHMMRGEAREAFAEMRGRGGRGRRRLFDPGELQLLLLSLTSEQPRHGYDLIREIEARSGGTYAPSPGVVYPALTYMEEAGWIAVAPDDGTRKVYAITDAGHAHLEEHAEDVATAAARLAALAQDAERTDPAPVRRAMHNLRTAVVDRLSRDDVDRALVLRIADLVDEAAKQIERIEP